MALQIIGTIAFLLAIVRKNDAPEARYLYGLGGFMLIVLGSF